MTDNTKELLEDLKTLINKILLELVAENENLEEQLENKERWIPVSERLPKAFETVLRTRVENGWNGTTYTIVDTGCICPADYNIIAWMPLPEPYKAEKPETCKGCLEPCIMYEPDMRACKKKVTERGE